MQRCKDAKMQRCKDAKMQRYKIKSLAGVQFRSENKKIYTMNV